MNNTINAKLSIEATNFPVKCCLPILIAETPKENADMNSGTITLLELNTDYIIGITCSHIIEECLEWESEGEKFLIQIGNLPIELSEHLIDNNPNLDLATLHFTRKEYKQMIKHHELIGSILLSKISTGEIKPGEYLAIGGFPGRWRKQECENRIVFDSFSINGCRANIIEQDKIYLRIDNLNNWPKAFDNHHNKIPAHPGGISGGPILLEIVSENGISHWELAGIITDGHFFNDSTLVIYGRPAHHIQADGKIRN